MKRAMAISTVVLALAAALCLFGCSAQSGIQGGQASGEPAGTTVFEETVSPNEEYVSAEDDIVYYTVRVTQGASETATVSAESNSAFFDPVSYEVECGKSLSENDVSVRWTTVMGSEEDSEDDMLSVAVVSVRTADGGIDERKINFANGALEMLSEAAAASQG